MKIIGTIQARLGSSRLPGKVLKEIAGKPLLLWHIERLKRSRLLDDVIVATTINPQDDDIVKLCKAHNIKYFRGSEEDLLNRIVSAIEEFKIDIHVEFFGDSPLTDAHIIDEVIGFYLKNKDIYDYVSNLLKTTYPPGQEVVVYRGSALVEVDRIVLPNDPLREHVSLNIVRNSKYKVFNLEAPPWYNYPEIYLEVDEQEDFELISNIVKYFLSQGQEYFSLAQILDYLNKNKELININNKIHRRWKEFRNEDR